MSAVRPLVLVYQELAGVSGAAETPTLESLIMGPCYHIQDYDDDRDDIEIEAYGDDGADSGVTGSPVGLIGLSTPAIILSEPPNNAIGAELDHDSVTIYMEETLVELAAGSAGEFTDTAPDEDLFESTDGVSFVDAGVRPGDRLAVTTTAGETYFKTISEVGTYDGSSLSSSQVRVTSNFTDGDNADLVWRVEHTVGDAEMPEDFIEFDEDAITITGGVDLMVTVDGDDYPAYVTYARLFVEYRSLRKDLALLQNVNENNIESLLGVVDERNPLAAGVSVALENTTTDIQVYGVDADNLNGKLDRVQAYAQGAMRLESRDDVYVIVPLVRDQSIVDALHQHAQKFSDPERAKFRTVIANFKELPVMQTVAGPSIAGTAEQVGADDVTVFQALAGTSPFQVTQAGDTFYLVDNDADPDVDPGFAEIEEVYADDRLYIPDMGSFASDNTTFDARYYVLRGAGSQIAQLTDVEVTGTDEITVPSAQASMDHLGMVIRLKDAVDNEDTSPVDNADFLITAVDDTTGIYTVVADGMVSGETDLNADIILAVSTTGSAVSSHVRQPYRRVLDNSANFVTNGVVPGDILQVPLPAQAEGAEFDDDVYEATVESIDSENRVVLSSGYDIPVTDPENGQTGDLGYRVERSLDKDGQKDDILNMVDPQTGYNSKRLVLIWPDEVLLSNVQNNKTGARTRQPGYYLGCAVAGMSAGLPPHQGFTFLGVSGIDELYHSTRYFDEDSLTELSNGGLYVFLQDTPTSTPYCLHQLTTDTSDTRNMEFSVVRVYDYVSRFYKQILQRFIGRYNVTPQTLDVLRESLNNGTDQLRGESLPRIGAPILGASVQSIEPLDGQRDRVEIYMSLDLPVPLNQIGLRLTA